MLRGCFFIATTLLLVEPTLAYRDAALATTYYVSPSGSNGNPGTSSGAPLATLQYAAGLTDPGDTVLAMSGTYTNDSPGDNILFVNQSGTASAPITFAAYPGQHPILQYADSWAAIRVSADYIVLDGFEIIGNAASVSKSEAVSNDQNLTDPVTNGDGIDVDQSAAGAISHHVTVEDMVIHDVPGGGIAVDQSDYVTVENNVIYNTSKWSPYGDSAISFYESQDVDTNTGIKNVIEGNTVFDNSEMVKCACRNYKSISDGNGIIIDDNLNAQGDGVAYGGRTVVAYNISSDNGGSGIHAFSSQHVDIINNTAYDNNQTSSINEGQIFSEDGADINIVNNILVAPAGKVITSNVGNATSVSEDYNVLWNVGGSPMAPAAPGPDDLIADPLMTAPDDGNFALQSGSPALGSGESGTSFAAAVPGAASVPNDPDRGAE